MPSLWKDAKKEQPTKGGFYLVMYEKGLPDMLWFSTEWHKPNYKEKGFEIVLWRKFPYPKSLKGK